MDVDEKKCKVVDFLGSLGGLRCVDENVDEIQKIHDQRMIEFFQLLFSVEMLWVEAADLLAFQRPDDCVII